MIKFRSWLRLPWPNIMLDGEASAQISKNLGHFLHFWNFLLKKHEFLFYALRHMALAFDRVSKSQKIIICGFGMEKYDFLSMAKKFGQVLSPQKGKKHSKNDLAAPILTHRK